MSPEFLCLQKLEEFSQLELTPHLQVWAGGTDLMLEPQGSPAQILDLTQIEGLNRIQLKPGEIRIGAATSLSSILNAPLLDSFFYLKQMIRNIASPPVRDVATIGGNIMSHIFKGELSPALAVYGAKLDAFVDREFQTFSIQEFIAIQRATSHLLIAAVILPIIEQREDEIFCRQVCFSPNNHFSLGLRLGQNYGRLVFKLRFERPIFIELLEENEVLRKINTWTLALLGTPSFNSIPDEKRTTYLEFSRRLLSSWLLNNER